jgi:hypothetical protein
MQGSEPDEEGMPQEAERVLEGAHLGVDVLQRFEQAAHICLHLPHGKLLDKVSKLTVLEQWKHDNKSTCLQAEGANTLHDAGVASAQHTTHGEKN